jgi:glucosamine kinase
MTDLVVGADVGGTSSRIAVADLDGRVVAWGTGGPGNPHSVGVEGSAREIRRVMDRVLGPLDGQVVRVVIGLAGGSRAAADAGFLRAAVSARVDAPAALVSDLTVAFASATPADRGLVLVAGTGSVAGEVVDDQLVAQRDGFGWLLGDQGSGFWIGRAAVRATLESLQRGRPLGPLEQAVLESSAADDYLGLLRVSYAAVPTWLASFAPLVSRHAAADPVAAQIAGQAADLLHDLLDSLGPRPGQPVVLSGSVLTTPGPVSDALRRRLAQRPDQTVLTSTSSVVGALWIGLRDLRRDRSAAHQRLVDTATRWM